MSEQMKQTLISITRWVIVVPPIGHGVLQRFIHKSFMDYLFTVLWRMGNNMINAIQMIELMVGSQESFEHDMQSSCNNQSSSMN